MARSSPDLKHRVDLVDSPSQEGGFGSIAGQP
jgi:hypothetical protein